MFSQVTLRGQVLSVSDMDNGSVRVEMSYTHWSKRDTPVCVDVVFPPKKAAFVKKSIVKGRTITVLGSLANGANKGVYITSDDFYFEDAPRAPKKKEEAEDEPGEPAVAKVSRGGGETYHNGKVDMGGMVEDDFDASKYAGSSTKVKEPKKQYAGDTPF